jgi:hypothetical protein
MTVEMERAEPADARRNRMASRALSLAVAALLLVGVVGLAVIKPDSAGPKGTPLAVVRAAATATTEVNTFKMKMEVVTGADGSDTKIPSVTGEGAAELTGDKRQSFTVAFGPITVETLLAAGLLYVRIPESIRHGAGPLWVAIDASLLPQPTAMGGLAGPSLPGAGDPTATLKALKAEGLVTSAVESGSQRIGGVQTTVYHLTLDPTRFEETIANAASSNPIAAGLKIKVTDPTLDLYVDDKGLVRREVQSMGFGAGLGDHNVSLKTTTTVDLSDFNQPVDIAIPPAGQVRRVNSMAELTPFLGPGG